MNVQILLFDGFDELDAIGPYEVFKNAAAAGAAIDARLATTVPARMVEASHGLRVWSHGELKIEAAPSLLLIPGGNWNNPAPQGVRREVASGEIPTLVAAHYEAGAWIASVCTGAMLLAAAGLLQQRRATTHHAAIEDLATAGAIIVDARVVDDGDIITAGGVTSGLDLALWIVERSCGGDIAHSVAARMEYERQGTVWQAQ